jgi:murein DD-endopeptidase MepM/ murein hydrolase activator NlpD
VLAPSTAAFAGVLEDQLAATRGQSKGVRQELNVVERRQQVVVQDVSRLNRKIAVLDVPIRSLDTDITNLSYRIEQRTKRIAVLKRDYVRQKAEIERLTRELDAARDLLEIRVVSAYMTGDRSIIEQIASAESVRDLFEREEALAHVVALDDGVIDRISNTERAVRLKRARNQSTRASIAADIKALDDDQAQLEQRRSELASKRAQLADVKAARNAKLSQLQERESELGRKLDDLADDAKLLQQAIESGATSYGGALSGSGSGTLIWPVSGPVVSPFGPRWGRMHEGVDIAIGAGNPIVASGSGVVTYAGWMGGYGNVVIIQHSGSFTTTYAHQSRIASHVGQPVAQGQLIGYVGCTGHCFGDHVHFETRINGSAVDPMQYL